MTESELKELRKIYSATLKNGSHLYECKTPKKAESFKIFLNKHLPADFAALVIRETQVNTFRQTITQPECPECDGTGIIEHGTISGHYTTRCRHCL